MDVLRSPEQWHCPSHHRQTFPIARVSWLHITGSRLLSLMRELDPCCSIPNGIRPVSVRQRVHYKVYSKHDPIVIS